VSAARSVNFAFLAAHDAVLDEYAAEAEGLFRAHPRLCVGNLRTLAEALAKHAAAYAGVYVAEREELGALLGRLRDRGVIDGQVGDLFRALREEGNQAVHTGTPDRPTRTFRHRDALSTSSRWRSRRSPVRRRTSKRLVVGWRRTASCGGLDLRSW
jgi:hypothetical protein